MQPPSIHVDLRCDPGVAPSDFITALGISEAFRDAELCATALGEALSGARPLEVAMADYHAERDLRSLPFYEFTAELATLEPLPKELQQVLAAVAGNPEAMDQFARVGGAVTSPADFLSEENLGRLFAAAGEPSATVVVARLSRHEQQVSGADSLRQQVRLVWVGLGTHAFDQHGCYLVYGRVDRNGAGDPQEGCNSSSSWARALRIAAWSNVYGSPPSRARALCRSGMYFRDDS